MQNSTYNYAKEKLYIGEKVKTSKSVTVTGNQHVGSHLLRIKLPKGVEGEIIGAGMYDQQKVVKIMLKAEDGTDICIHCPIMLNDLEK
jgi:hypothetical protein